MAEHAAEEFQNQKPKKTRKIFNLFVEIVVILAIVFGLSFLLRTFVFGAYAIPSASMETTIMTGDMVFSEKVSYYVRAPQSGDIVTFTDPETPSRTLIKRVIATEGQTITLKDGKVLVDGVALDEEYTNGKPSYELASTITFPYTVPQGYVWVMGDNRTNSQDSRYFGAIPVSSITGRAAIIYWPLNHLGLL